MNTSGQKEFVFFDVALTRTHSHVQSHASHPLLLSGCCEKELSIKPFSVITSSHQAPRSPHFLTLPPHPPPSGPSLNTQLSPFSLFSLSLFSSLYLSIPALTHTLSLSSPHVAFGPRSGLATVFPNSRTVDRYPKERMIA